MQQSELQGILEDHKLWLFRCGGRVADLRGADLREADLRKADLQGAKGILSLGSGKFLSERNNKIWITTSWGMYKELDNPLDIIS